jgi:hypothetical protein
LVLNGFVGVPVAPAEAQQDPFEVPGVPHRTTPVQTRHAETPDRTYYRVGN